MQRGEDTDRGALAAARAELGDRFQLVGLLGSGAGGDTFEAIDPRDGARVAIKRLALRVTRDWKSVELFEREARVLGGLRHPAIPALKEHFRLETPDGVSLYLVHGFAPGRSLRHWLEAGWRPDEQEIRRIAYFLLDVLWYLHSIHPPVVHRDIKPANVIRAEHGGLFLVDFGGVRDSLQTLSGGSTVVGTYGFMAPEQFRGHAVPASDLYGVAATLVYLLCGKAPTELPQVKLKVDLRSAVRASSTLLAWLDRLLEPAPEDRFSTAAEAIAALRSGTTSASRPKSAGSGRRLAALLTGLSLVVCGTAGFIAYDLHKSKVPIASGARVAPGAHAPISPLPRRVGAGNDMLTELRLFQLHSSLIFSAAVSPDEKTLLSGSDGVASIADLVTGEVLKTLSGHDGRVVGAAFTPDGTQCITGGGSSVRIWDTASGKLVRTLDHPHAAAVAELRLTADGKTMVTSGWDGTVKVWDFASGKELHAFEHGSPNVWGLAISPDGKRIATGGADGIVKTWTLEGQPVSSVQSHRAQIGRLAYSPDGLELGSVSKDMHVHVGYRDGASFQDMDAHEDETWALGFSPNGGLLVAGSKDKTATIMNPHTMSLLARQHMPTAVTGVFFMRSSQSVVITMGGGFGVYSVPHRRSGTRVPKPSTAAPPARAARNDREARYYEAMRIMLAWPAEPLSAASAELDRALDDDPRFAWGWVGRAQLALKEAYINGSDYDAKKTALARKHLDYAATLGPKDVEWYSVDAWVSRAEKKPGLAKESIRSALSLDADAYYALLAAAKIELDDHDYAGAVKHLTKVVERSRSKERLEWAYALLGDAYRGMGDIDALDEACSQAEALAPKNAWAFGNHAAHLLALGEVDRAIEKAEHALSLMDYGAARTVLASAHVQKGDDALWVARDGALAMREYEKALAASKSAAMAYYGRAAALRARAFEEKKPEPLAQARKDLETARTMVPDYKQYVRALEELDIIEREKLWEAK